MARRAARSVSRKNKPLSPPKPSTSAVFVDASNQNKRSTRSATREVPATQHQVQNISHVLGQIDEASTSQQADDSGLDISPSRSSISSGSLLQDELDSLNRDELVEYIGDLHGDAAALLSLFQVADDETLRMFCAKLSEPESLQRHRFQTRGRRFLIVREFYGNLDFIKVDIVVRKLAGTIALGHINAGPWRPDPILYLANLAVQMMAVFSTSSFDQHTYLQFMFNNFPKPFAGRDLFLIGPGMSERTVDIYIDILTQFYIREVEANKHQLSFDPDFLVRKIFLDEDNQLRRFEHNSRRKKAMERVKTIRKHVGQDARAPIDLDALKHQFPWSDFALKVVKWSMARKQELDGIIDSKGGIGHIKDLLAGDLGDDGTSAEEPFHGPGPRADITRRPPAVTANEEATRSGKKGKPGPLRGKALSANMERLRLQREHYAAQPSGAESDAITEITQDSVHEIPQSPTPVNDDDGGPADEDGMDESVANSVEQADDEEELVPTQQTLIVLNTIKRREEQSEKENRKQTAKKVSYMDPQEDAVQVQFNTPSDSEPDPSGRPGKHPRQEPEGSDDEDDFETDTRAAKRPRHGAEGSRQRSLATRNTARSHSGVEDGPHEEDDEDAEIPAESPVITPRRGNRPPQSTQASSSHSPKRPLLHSELSRESEPPRASTQQPTTREPLRPVSLSRLPHSTAPARLREDSTISPPPRPAHQEPPLSQVSRVNQEAKLAARLSRETYQGRGVQVRKPYTEAEVDRLMEMIELHGTKWARILDEDKAHGDGPLLQNRSQVQLKDKARNIKLDYLKARRRLPPGFESVSIGGRQIEILRGLGIDYVEGRFTGNDINAQMRDDDDFG
ncbi:uncharacterized protein Z518_04273 [Rhinocladiella mackenziei CBS 650.93]|uniref:Myb-like domain-containing protein n=1 Tax=Rhinocladiella mackenziei CBS 650.93 TaxID=1442369 RepID=A0A0D2H7B7_9EURO|nr:uncharacterized protein Z518_04273 [Rhinocladiella mackenziei CBS 650.93]KIX06298.1 hypothetical protein Z518_04273 [Rhinocladiella mackenziei CBS 650.93]